MYIPALSPSKMKSGRKWCSLFDVAATNAGLSCNLKPCRNHKIEIGILSSVALFIWSFATEISCAILKNIVEFTIQFKETICCLVTRSRWIMNSFYFEFLNERFFSYITTLDLWEFKRFKILYDFECCAARFRVKLTAALTFDAQLGCSRVKRQIIISSWQYVLLSHQKKTKNNVDIEWLFWYFVLAS